MHTCKTSGVCQTLDELDFERGIWYAAQHNDLTRVKVLLSKGKDVNEEDNFGYTALHYASRNGHLEMCKLLISNGANVNALTRAGKVNCLQRCASMGHFEIFKLLLSSGAFIDGVDDDGKTVLHRAVENNHIELAEEILNISPHLAKVMDKMGKKAEDYSEGLIRKIFR